MSSGAVDFLWRRVGALGVAQIVSWGTLFYTIAVLGSSMRAELGVSDTALFGGFTAGLFVSGLLSPWIGRRIDARGGRGVLAWGSVLAAAACVALATATGPVSVVCGWLLAGVAMAATLYDPALALLHRIAGTSYRRAVTAITLYGGFASTVFWPLSQFLLDSVGWRETFLCYAALHLLLCLPLHLVAIPRGGGESAATPAPAAADAAAAGVNAALPAETRRLFFWLATALALAAFIGSAMAAHLIDLLTATGLQPRDAVLIGTLIGPMQVAGRIMEFAWGRHVHALAVGTLAFALMVAALAVFTQVHGIWIVALAFVIPYGWANGVMTIVRGTVPAELFGHRGYGALLGRLALPQFILKAAAPFALTLLFVVDPERVYTPYALLLVAVLALIAFRMAVTTARRR